MTFRPLLSATVLVSAGLQNWHALAASTPTGGAGALFNAVASPALSKTEAHIGARVHVIEGHKPSEVTFQ